MKQWIEKNNRLTKLLREWKKEQGIESVSIEEMRDILKEAKTAIIEYKMDGELGIFHKKGDKARFASLQGRIREELPVLDELRRALKKFDDIKLIGELIALDKRGQPLRFNDTISVLRDPTSKEEKQIVFYFFEVFEVDGKKIDNANLEEYKTWMDKIKELISVDLPRSVFYKKGGIKTLNEMWEQWAIKEKQEGLVVRLDGGKIYKIKTVYTFDAVIIFVTRGTGKYKNVIGATGVALMPKSDVFAYIGLVGTGWKDEMRSFLMDFAKKNSVDIKENEFEIPFRARSKSLIWVKPQIIIEVKWKDLYEQIVPLYSYQHGKWSYIGEGPGVIMREPRFVRIREDKEVIVSDLRMTQIPDWQEKKKRLEKEKEKE